MNTYKYSVHMFTIRTCVHSNKQPETKEERMNATLNYQPHWVREDFVDFVLQKINATWAWKRVLAEVTAV